jgi:hypothetical protein
MPIGDILAISAEETLTNAEPYPGDTAAHCCNQGRWPKMCHFKVKQVSKQYHMIEDSLCRSESFILTEHLRTPGFALPKWYAEECERRDLVNSMTRVLPDRFHHIVNGDSLADGAAALLQEGGPFPGDEYHFVMKDRFEVVPDPESYKCYQILDFARNIETQLPRYLLEDHDFNLLKWYDKQLNKP